MKKFILATAMVTFLVGCEEEVVVDTLDNGVMPQEVVVELLSSEKQQPQQAVQLKAQVTQGEEMVEDASVQFEVWESGLRESGDMLEGTYTDDGIYTAQYTFAHDGVYYMYAHTNAHGLHVMPKQEIIVGQPDMSQVLPDDSSSTMSEMPHGELENHHHE